MILPIIIDIMPQVEAPLITEFYRALDMQKRCGGAIVAQEEYFNSPSTFSEKGRIEAQNDGFLLQRYFDVPSEKDLELITPYAIPKKLFDEIIYTSGSYTDAMHSLVTQGYEPLEEWLSLVIEDIYAKRNELPSCFLTTRDLASVKNVAQKFDIPIFYYEWASFREPVYSFKAHLDTAGVNLTAGTEERFNQFCKELKTYPKSLLTAKEILALTLQPKYMKLLSLYDTEPSYEVGVVLGIRNVPIMTNVAFNHPSNYDSLRLAIDNFQNNEILIRSNPNNPDRNIIANAGLPIDGSETAAEFIIKCRRTIAIASNMTFETMLWNRSAFSFGQGLCRSQCMEKIDSTVKNPDIRFLNFMSFAFYIPFEWVYNEEYLMWRINEKPSEIEIYQKHLEYVLSCLELDIKILNFGVDVRLGEILQQLGFDINGFPILTQQTDYGQNIMNIMQEWKSTELSKREEKLFSLLLHNIYHKSHLEASMHQEISRANALIISMEKAKKLSTRIKLWVKRFLPYSLYSSLVKLKRSIFGPHDVGDIDL